MTYRRVLRLSALRIQGLCRRTTRVFAPSATLRGGRTFAQEASFVSISRTLGGTLSKYVLKLYVTGSNTRAEAAIANLTRICELELHGEYELHVIDVLANPQVAEDEKILATPTLIKQLPPPLRRVIGDLSDKEKVLLGLELRPGINPAEDKT